MVAWIAKELGVTTLRYQTIEDMVEAIGCPRKSCAATAGWATSEPRGSQGSSESGKGFKESRAKGPSKITKEVRDLPSGRGFKVRG